jgi:outer membrane murein-binding lipoprotein Lpp
MFDRLAQHLDQLANDVEQAMSAPKASQELSG